jgi:hypothetical protein
LDIKALIFGKKDAVSTSSEKKEAPNADIKEAYIDAKDATINRQASSSLYMVSTALSLARFFGVALILALCAIFWLVAHPAKPQPFAVTPQGRIIPIKPLSDPIIGEDQLLSIAQNNIVQAYTFTFANYNQQMAYLKPLFSHAAFIAFQNSLVSSKTIGNLQSQKLIISAVPLNAPSIVAQGSIGGALAWHIQMKILINYASDGVASAQNRTKYVNIVLQRANTTKYPIGVRIVQLYASNAK